MKRKKNDKFSALNVLKVIFIVPIMELNKLKSEGTDISLQLLKEKLVSDDFSISIHFSSRLNAAFLKESMKNC